MNVQPELPVAGAVVRVADHPQLRDRIHRLARRGELVRVLPGTYVTPGALTDRCTRLAAACAWSPQAVLWGPSALDAASACPDPFGRREEIFLAGRARHARPGIAWYSVEIPDSFVITDGGLRFVRPVVAAAGLAATDGGVAIDRLLMREPSAGADLAAVADWFERRNGNAVRRQVLAEVRRRPWSGLERELRRLLRHARIGGWQANVEVCTPQGTCVPDVLFEEVRLVLEVDSWEYHGSRDAFEPDRRRQNGLVLAGYRVLRITADMLSGNPAGVIGVVRSALRTGPQGRGARYLRTPALGIAAAG